MSEPYNFLSGAHSEHASSFSREKDMATAAKANAVDSRPELTQYSDMGFVLTTDPDNTLPDMDGFEREYCGTAESGWISPCEIRAGRDLAVGEKLVACLVRQRDGKMLEQLEFTASSTDCAQAVWPGAFASAVAKRKKQVVAGNFNGDNHFKTDGTALPVRLWHYSCANRAFTTAPFSNNQVQALAITGEDLEEGTRLCVQVRDISTQALYEHHFFSVKKGRLKQTQWSQDLCTALNEDSRLLRAGVKDTATCLITPASSGNALWVPQDSDLAVTLTRAGWINTGTVDGATDLKPGQSLTTYVLDAFSGKEVVPAFSYTPDGDSCGKQGVWLGKWAEALKASDLAPYVRVGSAEVAGNEDVAADAQSATVWQSGDGIRVFTTAPGLDSWVGGGDAVPASLASYGSAVKNEGKKYQVFRLSSEARRYGVRVLATSQPDFYPDFRADGDSASSAAWLGYEPSLYENRFEATLQFDFPESVPGNQKLTVGQVGWIDGNRLWGGRRSLEVMTPAPAEPYSATSPLCEDYGNTFRSEVFDVSGEVETGVDTRTGLFHAHYPVATLQGLEGNGPICDLTLHYSALRGNEAGLGDGWAFRFSSLDTRERRLTLADGITISFDEADWALLGKKDQCIRKKACWVTSCANDYSEFKLDYPSGTREYLTQPVGDSHEPDDALRQTIIALLEKIKVKAIPDIPQPSGWDWVVIMASAGLYVAAATADWMDALAKWQKNTKEIDAAIDYWKRPFNQLLPTRIISPGAGELSLTWNRLLGQFRLVEIKSGSASLFSATYTHSDVLMKVWEGTDEAYQVDLELKDYLMMEITHYDSSTPKGRVPTVRCSYSEDPTLDRILTRLRESDGSVECVTYQAKGMPFPKDRQPALPRATRHVLLPGGRQENVITQFEYGTTNYLSDDLEYDISIAGEKSFKWDGWGPPDERISNGRMPVRYIALLKNLIGDDDDRCWLADQKLYRVRECSANGASVEHVFDASHRKVAEIEDCQSTKIINIYGFYVLNRRPVGTGHGYPLTVTTCTIWEEAPPGYQHVGPADYLTITEQAFTYNADGQLTKSVVADGTITQWCYYPRVKGDGLSISTVADESIKALQGLKLGCPNVPEQTLPPVMAEFQYQVFEGKKLPLGLTLYGYQARACNGRILLSACDIVKLDGVIANPDTWELSLAPGRTTALITHERVSEESRKPKTMKDGCKAFVWEARRDQTTYFGKESTRLINTLAWEDNPQEKRGFILRSQASTDSGTETLSTEIRSRYTRRCVVRRQGREEARYTYDLMGRPTSEQRFVIKAGANRVEEDAEPVSAQTTEYSVLTEKPEDTDAIINKGLQAITTLSDGHVIRTLIDGLQREVRRELLAPGLAKGCVLDELECSGVQSVRNQTRYDYYPGGLRRRTESGDRGSLIDPPEALATEALKTGEMKKSALTAYLDAWGEEYVRAGAWVDEPPKPAPQTDDPTKSTTIENHLLAGREIFTRTLDEEVLANGGIRRIENQTTASGLKRPEVTREYDPVGNLIRMKRADVEQPMTMEYDELHRVTKVITPDGSVIAREYFGLSHQVTRLTVDEVVVGRQTVQAPSRLLERRVGERSYAYQSHAITLPDKQVLTTDASENGGTSLLLNTNPLSTLRFDRPGKTTTVVTHDAVNRDTSFWLGPLSEKMTLPGLSGNVQHQIKTPRGTRSAWSACSLMGHVLSARRTDGSLWRPFLDRDERTLRELHNGMDSLYHYGADGSMCRQETVAAQTGNRMSTEYRHDDFGQETFREYELNGARALSIEQRWSDYGLLIGSTLSRDGKVLRSETFSHDSCDRLSTYRCTATEAADYPADAQDRPVKQQDFKWDGLQRLKSCATTFADDQTLNQAYDYDPLNPTRCLSINGSSTEDPITLQWSVNGCLEQDAAGNRLRYNAQGQLLEVRDAQQHTLTRYAYDGYGRLAAQYVAASEETCELCYDGDSLCGEIWFDRDGKVLRQVMLGTDQFQQTVTSAGAPQIVFLMGSPHSGTIGCWRGGVVKDLSLSGFTPFGDQGNGLPECCKGYNDQRRDPVTGCYHLGNGYRTYNPSLRSFQQPDSLSPFDEGGINDYSYCCNPLDFHDPSGHIMLSRWHKDQMISNMEKTLRETRPQPVGNRWRGIALSATLAAAGVLLSIPTGGASLAFFAATTALSVTALALEIASKFVEDSNPELAKKLGIASMAIGLTSTVMGIGQQLARLLRWGASAIGKIVTKVQGIRDYWNLVKLKGFKKAAEISKAAARPAKQHKVGTIFQQIASEYTEYLGDGKTRVVRGWLARATNERPELFARIRWLNHNVAPLMQPLAVGGFESALNSKDVHDNVTDLYRV